MLTRPLVTQTRYLGTSQADNIARQFAGTEQPGIPPCTYFSAPGYAEMLPSTPHPDGGYAWGMEAPMPAVVDTSRRTR